MVLALTLCKIGKGYAGYFGMQRILHAGEDREQMKNHLKGWFFC
jgi:hypothetical protein